MPRVTLTGFLICRSLEEADRVSELLDAHLRATRAEPGCLSFEVVRSMADPARFAVREVFADRAAYDAHQARLRQTRWWLETEGIPRDYRLTEEDGDPAAGRG